ncbi:hypothetical protein JOE31_001367 [Arthrobacter sp. PvP023]|nr:hypothetical protein [Arthrobacter sp. PvP023]MBP1135135.1 hypothetical protein [Arthrobacter sp. PvP023]
MTTSSVTPRGRHRAELVAKPRRVWRPYVGLAVFSLIAVVLSVAFTLR